jgi:hypothetical protein
VRLPWATAPEKFDAESVVRRKHHERGGDESALPSWMPTTIGYYTRNYSSERWRCCRELHAFTKYVSIHQASITHSILLSSLRSAERCYAIDSSSPSCRKSTTTIAPSKGIDGVEKQDETSALENEAWMAAHSTAWTAKASNGIFATNVRSSEYVTTYAGCMILFYDED